MQPNLQSDTIQHADGRVELRDYASISSSPLYNEDLAPIPVAKRNWTTYNYAALWISMAHCIPTYMLSSGLISAGMNWWQALITILLGNKTIIHYKDYFFGSVGVEISTNFRVGSKKSAFVTFSHGIALKLKCGIFINKN